MVHREEIVYDMNRLLMAAPFSNAAILKHSSCINSPVNVMHFLNF